MLTPRDEFRRLSGRPGVVESFQSGNNLATSGLELANRANVNRLKPMLQKMAAIESRALSRRSAAAASMTDAELEAALAQNWTEEIGWEVTRRQKLAELQALRANEPADDIDTAESEVSRGA
jgi:hypothetical protein